MKVLFAIGCMMLLGCASSPKPADTRLHGECLVCKYDGDLACVDVVVEQETPSYVYQGKTYYFCSQQCQGNFSKHPEKYLAK